jgi:hypothetical protein
MGAWGHLAFDNDMAADWVVELESANDLSPVLTAIKEVEAAGDGYLDQDAACVALAACEVIAHLRGKEGTSASEPVDTWVAEHPLIVPPALSARAAAAIERILAPESELRELWDETGAVEWEAATRDLLDRLKT